MTEYRSLSERRGRDRAPHAFVRTRVGRRLCTGSPAKAWSYISDHFAGYALYQSVVNRKIPSST